MFYDPRAKGQSTWPPQRHQTVHWLGHRFVGNALNAGPCQRQPLNLNSVFCPIASNLSLASPPPLSIRPPARQQAYNQGEHHPLLPFLCPTLSLCQTSLEHFAPPLRLSPHLIPLHLQGASSTYSTLTPVTFISGRYVLLFCGHLLPLTPAASSSTVCERRHRGSRTRAEQHRYHICNPIPPLRWQVVYFSAHCSITLYVLRFCFIWPDGHLHPSLMS